MVLKYWSKFLALTLIVSILIWGMGLVGIPFTIFAHASNTSFTSDTLSTSAPSIGSNHSIQFTTPTGVSAGQTITITFPAGFGMGSIATSTDIAMGINSTSTTVTLAGACSGSTWGVGVSGQIVTFTSCTGTVTAGQYVYIRIGTNAPSGAHQITNQAATGSYSITIGGTMADSGVAMVAIVNQVTMTAQVSTSLIFTISGVAAGSASANSENSPATTTVTTTATSVPWGLLTAGVPKTARQDLSVATNAQNGFVVTIQENQPLTSGTGAIINNFKDGASTTPPTVWTSPLGTLGNSATYGHWGITSSSTEAAGEFQTTKYAGNVLAAPRIVFSNNGPADGTTQNVGLTNIGFKIQISALQAAGNDYTNVLTYVCTPTF